MFSARSFPRAEPRITEDFYRALEGGIITEQPLIQSEVGGISCDFSGISLPLESHLLVLCSGIPLPSGIIPSVDFLWNLPSLPFSFKI
jgi:hypothetical protein